MSTQTNIRGAPIYLVLNTGVLSLGVLTDENSVHVVIRGFVAFDGHTRADIGEEVEGAPECEVEGDVTLANWIQLSGEVKRETQIDQLGVASGPDDVKISRKEWGISYRLTLESNSILANGRNRVVRDDCLAILENGCNTDLLPLDGNLNTL